MDINLSKIKKIVVPVGVVLFGGISALLDWKKSEKVDELIEKVDNLTKKED